MLASKDAHFAALAEADTKRNNGEQQTLAESAYIAQLLSTHDSCVADFSSQMRELGERNKEAQMALLNAITLLNRDLGNDD